MDTRSLDYSLCRSRNGRTTPQQWIVKRKRKSRMTCNLDLYRDDEILLCQIRCMLMVVCTTTKLQNTIGSDLGPYIALWGWFELEHSA